MTLIAAFRCESAGEQGVVVCADSQETVGNYRVAVDKIKPRDAGSYELIIGGSGYIAALIDGLANAVERNVQKWPAGLDEESARLCVERALIGYHARQIAAYPNDPTVPDYKVMRFLVCVRDKTTSQVYLWKTDGPTAERVEDYALIGWEEAVYEHLVKWLYRKGMQINQAVLLGVHLLSVAQNSLYVGGDTQVIVAHKNGMMAEDPNEVRRFEQRISMFNAAIGRLILACPDTSIEPDDFTLLLASFIGEAMQLHDEYCADAMTVHVLQYIANRWSNPSGSYLKIPIHKTMEFIEKAREHAQERTEKAVKGDAVQFILREAQRLSVPITEADVLLKPKTSEGQP